MFLAHAKHRRTVYDSLLPGGRNRSTLTSKSHHGDLQQGQPMPSACVVLARFLRDTQHLSTGESDLCRCTHLLASPIAAAPTLPMCQDKPKAAQNPCQMSSWFERMFCRSTKSGLGSPQTHETYQDWMDVRLLTLVSSWQAILAPTCAGACIKSFMVVVVIVVEFILHTDHELACRVPSNSPDDSNLAGCRLEQLASMPLAGLVETIAVLRGRSSSQKDALLLTFRSPHAYAAQRYVVRHAGHTVIPL